MFSGALLRATNLTPSNYEEILRAIGTVDEDDATSIATFIRRCLTIDPASRPTALELLKDTWLQDV